LHQRIDSETGQEDLEGLAKWELASREIKNAIKTGRTWCICGAFETNLKRLESGIMVTAPKAKKFEVVEEVEAVK